MYDFDIFPIAEQVAAKLGEHWQAERGVHHQGRDAWLRGSYGEEIHFYINFVDENRFCLHGSFNGYRDHIRYNEPRHEISVTRAKTAAQIAREITRRLLPKYRETLIRAQESKRQQEEDEDVQAALVQELLSTLGGSARQRNSSDVVFGTYNSGINGTVSTPHPNMEVRFTINVPASLALSFAAVVERMKSEHDAP